MLYVVATPIGNLGDMTVRAIDILKTCDVVFAEDTRVTKKLLTHIGSRAQLQSYREQNHARSLPLVRKLLREGKQLALVSDAGTPGISDPGSRLVRELRTDGTRITPIPGASAISTLLSVSGFPSDQFYFAGFPPAKKGRASFFASAKKISVESRSPIIFFESPHRLRKTLAELVGAFGTDAMCCVGRELTKMFEEIYLGTLCVYAESLHLGERKPRGEYVIIIAPQGK